MAEDSTVEKILRDTTQIIRTEDLLMEAMRDLVKDEIKKYVKNKLDASPALKQEIKKAVEELMEAKVKEGYALVKLAKAGMKLGLELVPPRLREEFSKDLIAMFQKEIGEMFEKTS